MNNLPPTPPIMMLKQTLMHGSDWQGEDLAGWLATEKFDGCRAWWDGKTMWSRSGRHIALPMWMVAELPSIPLDGEIWAGRGRFTLARLAVQYGQFDPAHHTFQIFDAPAAKGDWLSRLLAARAELESGVKHVAVVKPVMLESTEAAFEKLISVLRGFGEGLMLRHPRLPYRAGRTRQMLKFKQIALQSYRQGWKDVIAEAKSQ